MSGLKLNKSELRQQKSNLEKLQRFLPMMQLKKQQLQQELRRNTSKINEKEKLLRSSKNALEQWSSLFGKEHSIEKYIQIKKIITKEENIAGISIPIFLMLEFEEVEYDFFETPFWLEKAIIDLKNLVCLEKEVQLLNQAQLLLQKELDTITQRVNLFEKIIVPQTEQNIRKIKLYLNDQQTMGVIRGKKSKNKIRSTNSL